MEIAFATREFRDTCVSAELAEAQLGKRVASDLLHRLADIRAVKRIHELVVGDPRAAGDHIVIEVAGTHTLRVASNHVKSPRTHDGRIDWSRVRRVVVLDLVDREDD